MLNPSVTFTRKDHIGYITLNSSETGNLITRQMAQELEEICTQVGWDDYIYVVVLAGAGDDFCVGGEVVEPETAAFSGSRAVAGINQPVIAAIDGEALGAGLELALACDIRIASDRARFGLPQVAAGLIPSDGGTQRLPRVVGKGKALEMLLTDEIIDADTALEIGLVHKVVAPDKLLAEAEAIAGNIATKAPIALKFAKEAVNKGMDLTLEQGLRLEADLYFVIHTTADRTEGIQTFLQKKQPRFQGK